MPYKLGEVKKITGVHRDTIRRYVKAGKIEAYRDKFSGHWMVTEKGLQDLIQGKKIEIAKEN